MKRINYILITAMALAMVAMVANADIPPAPAVLNNDTGNYWVNYTWSNDLGCPDNDNVTDSFNVSMNDTWYNGTATFLNKSVGPGGWANITVWAYNATGNGNMSVGNVSDDVQAPAMVDPPDDNPCTIMHPDSETLREWIESYNAAPTINISGGGVMAPSEYSVLDRLDYNAAERDQGWCGNCWVWAATGCMEVAHDVENDVFGRLSIQYLNSLYYDGAGAGYACNGGNLDMFADFYSVNTTFAIPWNNTNASWQDGGGGTSTTVPADSISTTPHYTIVRIEETTIPTQEVENATAIANIKSVLASDNAIWFAFYLPNSSDWKVFETFWDDNAETDLWSPDYSCGHTWVDGEGGGHAVLCVGYNDTDPDNRYWIMLNSWGASANRPNGLFRMNMSINYDCYYVDGALYYSLYWQMLDIDFAVPAPMNLQNTTGNYWVNYTWTAGTGTVTDGYNVSMNKEWHNGTETFLNSSVGAGNWSNITVWAWNATGNGNMSVGNVSDNVQAPAAYTPTDPDTLANSTGNYWVNYTWGAGEPGNVTDSYNVRMNGTWTNETTDTFVNVTVGPSGWANITVWAYNASGAGTLSAGSISDEVQAPAAPTPAITSWDNNKTDNNSTAITVNESVSVRFNATANQTIETWNWYNSGINQSNNFDNYTTSWSVNGTNTISVNATNANGTSNTVAWTVTVNDITAPDQVLNLANDTTTVTTVDLSWDANTEADLAGYRVYQNGALLGSPPKSQTYYNVTGLSPSTTYKFNVSAYDDNDLEGENASIVVTTAVGPLHHINMTPTSWTMNDNESRNFTATGCDQNNGTVPDLVFEWAISDACIGSLTPVNDTATKFTADHVGITYITASNGSVTSNPVQVTVNAGTDNTTFANKTTFRARSGDANVTGNFKNNVSGWINATARGNATNSSEVNQSNPRSGLGSGDKVMGGVIVNVSKTIRSGLDARNGTIRIEICYNATTLDARGIDASTLAIWKYDNDAEKWVKQSSTRSGRCVYVDVNHLCTFALVGSKAISGSGSGSGGTYPPGWGAPTSAVTATKAPAATDAPPGERVTPASTKKPAASKAATPAAEGTTAGTPAKNGAPGFTAIFAIAGLLAIAYVLMRRRG